MKKLGLEHRICNSVDAVKKVLDGPIDYSEINSKLSSWRNECSETLMRHINNNPYYLPINSLTPKKIHYCWFGGNPLPESAIKCIDSWRKFFPDYEIVRWDESNFDVNAIPYTEEAYRAKKYAFVSDYARFKILYEEGGLYFDTDVEVIKDMSDIIVQGPFMGCEKPYREGANPKDLGVAPGLGLGVSPGHPLYKELLDFYSGLSFLKNDGSMDLTTIVEYTGRILSKHGLKMTPNIQTVEGIYIYPHDYFAPKSVITKKLTITENTRSIHHYDSTWAHPASRRAGLRTPKIKDVFGDRIGECLGIILFFIDKYFLFPIFKR